MGRLLEFVCDEDDRLPLVGEFLENVVEALDLLGSEDGGRFVENENVRTAEQRLEDLDALLDADAHVFDGGVRIDLEAVSVTEVANLAVDTVPIDGHSEPLRRLVPERDVLGDRHGIDQHEVLVDHPDTGVDGVPGESNVRSSPSTTTRPSSGW